MAILTKIMLFLLLALLGFIVIAVLLNKQQKQVLHQHVRLIAFALITVSILSMAWHLLA